MALHPFAVGYAKGAPASSKTRAVKVQQGNRLIFEDNVAFGSAFFRHRAMALNAHASYNLLEGSFYLSPKLLLDQVEARAVEKSRSAVGKSGP